MLTRQRYGVPIHNYNVETKSLFYITFFLFRVCLDLVSSSEQSVKEELDFITALSALAEYNVSILPLQGVVAKISGITSHVN